MDSIHNSIFCKYLISVDANVNLVFTAKRKNIFFFLVNGENMDIRLKNYFEENAQKFFSEIFFTAIFSLNDVYFLIPAINKAEQLMWLFINLVFINDKIH